MHNIFQVNQQPLSKLFIMSQQTFTCSNSTRETIEVDVVLMLTLNIIHTIFTPDFKQGNVYWDSFFWLWYNIHLMHNKILHRFFSNNKALLSRIRASFADLQRSRLSKRNGLNENRYKHSSLARRKLYKCICTNLN